MTVEKNGPFYRITMTEEEMIATLAMFPYDMQIKIKEAEEYWETQRPRIRNAVHQMRAKS
jgi:hypothetical protein